MTCVINLVKLWLCVDSRHTWDHLVDALIKIMKYLKGLHNGWMGPQMSPSMHSRTLIAQHGS
jgi:hypothetical protein